MNTELIHINDFTGKCGYFNSKTIVNNGYGCNHSGCDDGDNVRLLKNDWIQDYFIDGNFIFILAQSMTKRNIKCNKRLAKKFIKKARHIEYDNKELKKYGFKWQGRCHTFTCPLGHEADKQDILEHNENPEQMEEGEWLVVDSCLI